MAAIGRIIPPGLDVHTLILGTCEHVTLRGRGTLQV